MANNTTNRGDLEDFRALRRNRKKRWRMKQHGHALKKSSIRPVLHIQKKQKKNTR